MNKYLLVRACTQVYTRERAEHKYTNTRKNTHTCMHLQVGTHFHLQNMFALLTTLARIRSYTYKFAHVCAYTHRKINFHSQKHTHTRTLTQVRTLTHKHTHTCSCVRAHVRAYTHTYTQAGTHTNTKLYKTSTSARICVVYVTIHMCLFYKGKTCALLMRKYVCFYLSLRIFMICEN